MRFLLALAFLSVPAQAQTIALEMPLNCTLGEDCFIQQYVDADPGPGARDYTGGPLSYDGHRGTDFRVADLEAMAEGVAVLAPADGVIRGIRDGMADRIIADRSEVANRECGNGVAIDHGNGWSTQLCHLAKGSVSVAVGDQVVTGQAIGLMGISGATQFPHVHVTVRQDGVVVDPFVENLWRESPPYEPGGFLSVGLADDVPTFGAVKAGTADAQRLPPDAPALVVWAALFGGRTGDVVSLRIFGPEGEDVFSHDATLDRTQAELFRAAGRRLRGAEWPAGSYRGTAVLTRDGAVIDRIETEIPIGG
ncbi:peptidase M23 [Jannaschia pagri]|uniref:Peptidase M23 n=1 Tax=Jannaschia pagri TaxID=2829797 RepID=A0ABQ4NKQ7_9RHOB|nr:MULTISPECIES: M23 family metallopeptidase [unclassified Jannaschia]GIT91169.1 peptidase M23 [Jannaschia sp. AI_61]GIT95001.1 peptidase M23 [Jannaschia sp. AI_62]